jgi:hypothetical protein
MKYGIKGKGAEIKWVEEIETDLFKEVVKLREDVKDLKQLVDKQNAVIEIIKLDNIEIVKGLISR